MAKGSSYERDIAKEFSLWLTKGKRDDILYRSQSSGARFTQRRKSGKDTVNQAGDITFTDELGASFIKKYNLELKTGYGKKNKDSITKWDVLDIIDSKQKLPVLIAFWNQCTRDAELSNRTPLLIFRRNQRSSCICFDIEEYNKLITYFGSCNCLYICCNNLMIMSLKMFFEWIPNISPYLEGGDLK